MAHQFADLVARLLADAQRPERQRYDHREEGERHHQEVLAQGRCIAVGKSILPIR